MQSREEVWFLKEIAFFARGEMRMYKVITQNFNGPCSFIAICNILILRDQICIEPPNRASVSYDYLAQLVAEHLLLSAPDVDISAALSIMPLTTQGMDLNPVFTGPTRFRPATTGGELDLFARAGIPLVHGWLADPASPEHAAVARAGDYDAAVNLIVEADVLTKGRLVQTREEDECGAGPSGGSADTSTVALTPEQRRKVEDAVVLQTFLDNTRSQLTYHGLFTLASLSLSSTPTAAADDSDAPQFFALFRNAHLSVLYKHPDGSLYTLATDEAFLREPAVVWERLEDVDQGAAVFVDAQFERSAPVGGDWAGWTPDAEPRGVVDPADHMLAKQLQEEEDRRAQEAYAARQQERRAAQEARQAQTQAQAQAQADAARKGQKREKKRGGGDCVIM
ncbi:hypothetical protein K488DRAFT_56416 [Vararia minispora EC-137]|uniref:Uncharacterized protein n=1 Tax=Vararia minispora EC-137 TaxID=1314806 RepID=A0ACB8QCV8_9AGAM|nr:hypothetical protein K488DRAFT_56416 [Vararia minispora EC-137]